MSDDGAAAVLKDKLFAGAAVITPNLPEAEALCGFALREAEDLRHAGDVLLETGARAVLLKGGHGGTLEGGETLTDLLFVGRRTARLHRAALDTPHTHGTGCTLSTAIACGLAQGLALPEAVERAHAFVQHAIRSAPGLGAASARSISPAARPKLGLASAKERRETKLWVPSTTPCRRSSASRSPRATGTRISSSVYSCFRRSEPCRPPF